MSNFEAKVEQLKKEALYHINADILLKEAEAIIAPPLNDKEQRVNTRLQSVPGLVVAHGLGTGKALENNTPVITPNGFKLIKDLNVGDLVIGVDGKATKVIGVYPQGELELFNVTFQDGTSVKTCGEHLWFTQTHKERKNFKRVKNNQKFKGKVRSLFEINNTINENHSIPITKAVEFEEQEVNINPYLLGLLIGDGCFHKKYISISTADEEIYKSVCDMLPKGYTLTKHGKYDYNIVNKHTAENNVFREITALGLKEKKSWNKFIPLQFKFNTISVRLKILQGLLDTDGSVDKTGYGVNLSTCSKQLAEDCVFLVQSLGGIATITVKTPNYTYKGERKKGRENFRVWIKLRSEFPPFKLKRKIDKVKVQTKYLPIRFIKTIKPIGKYSATCIAIDSEKKLFLVNDFIVTHNTRTSIQVANKLQQPTNVVVPAALQDNYKKELNKWLGTQPNYLNIQSQQRVGRTGLNPNNNGLLVVDEAHRARERSSKLYQALQQSEAKKRLLLTATPVYNHPVDLAPLVNLAARKNVLPEDRAAFTEKYIEEKPINPGILGSLFGIKPGVEQKLNPKPDLIDAIDKYVDYDPGRGAEGFPSFKEEVVKVPMSTSQQNIYNTIMDKAPFWVRWKVRAGLPPNRTELQPLQAFLTGARQVANSTYDFIKDKNTVESPKVETAVSYLQKQLANNPRYKAVVYSNYLGSGLAPYKMQLDKAKIPYGEFSGDISAKVRNQMVKDYNANKLKALLISSAGAEGLDLKGTRLLQIIEPHFNREKEKQIVGRAIRYMSHAGLPADEQNVLIQRYLSQPKGSWIDRLFGNETISGTDEYISNIADKKEQLNRQFVQLIAQRQNENYGAAAVRR